MLEEHTSFCEITLCCKIKGQSKQVKRQEAELNMSSVFTEEGKKVYPAEISSTRMSDKPSQSQLYGNSVGSKPE